MMSSRCHLSSKSNDVLEKLKVKRNRNDLEQTCKDKYNLYLLFKPRIILLCSSDLESLKPDTTSMKNSETTGKIMGVIVTLKGTPDNGCVNKEGEMYDFVTRYFAPWNGIPEDPVTGKIYCYIDY